MYKTYRELIEDAMMHCNDAEKKRIEAENNYFVQHGWTEYILFVANLLMDYKEQGEYVEIGNFGIDVYTIFKTITNTEYRDDGIFNQDNPGSILNKNILNLNLDVLNLAVNYEQLKRVGNVLEKHLKESGFKYSEHMIPQERESDTCELILISNDEISKEAVEIAAKGLGKCSEEELGQLGKYLIIQFASRVRV